MCTITLSIYTKEKWEGIKEINWSTLQSLGSSSRNIMLEILLWYCLLKRSGRTNLQNTKPYNTKTKSINFEVIMWRLAELIQTSFSILVLWKSNSINRQSSQPKTVNVKTIVFMAKTIHPDQTKGISLRLSQSLNSSRCPTIKPIICSFRDTSLFTPKASNQPNLRLTISNCHHIRSTNIFQIRSKMSYSSFQVPNCLEKKVTEILEMNNRLQMKLLLTTWETKRQNSCCRWVVSTRGTQSTPD